MQTGGPLFDHRFAANGPATVAQIRLAESLLGCDLPPQYRAFLLRSDGGQGFIGHSYLHLWPVSELKELNDTYEARSRSPDILMFGSDGGLEAFAFRRPAWKIVRLPFIGEIEDADPLADTFNEFFTLMRTGGWLK